MVFCVSFICQGPAINKSVADVREQRREARKPQNGDHVSQLKTEKPEPQRRWVWFSGEMTDEDYGQIAWWLLVLFVSFPIAIVAGIIAALWLAVTVPGY